MDITEKAKKVVASSVAGLGVLGSLLGMGFKGNAKADDTMTNLTQELQRNSTDLLSLAQQLGGEEGEKLQQMGQYINKVAAKMAQGEMPTEEEIKETQEKLDNLNKTSSPSDSDNYDGASSSADSDKLGDKGEKTPKDSEKDSPKDDGNKTAASGGENKSREDSPQKSSAGGEKEKQGDKDKDSKPESRGSGGKGESAEEGKEKTGAEEMSEDVDKAQNQMEEIGTKLEEMGKMLDDLTGESEKEAEELDDSSKQLDDLLQSLTEKLTENETEIDTQEEETLQQFTDFQNTLAELAKNLAEIQETSAEKTPEITNQIESNQQSLKDNFDKIDTIITQIIDGEYLKDNNDNDDNEDNIETSENLTEVIDKVENSLTSFQGLLETMNNELENQVSDTEEKLTNVVEIINNSQLDLGEKIGDMVTEIRETKTSQIENNFTNFRENLTQESNQFIQENITLLNDFRDTAESSLTNFKTVIENTAKNEMEEEVTAIINQLLTFLQQRQENYRQIYDLSHILTELIQVSEDLSSASEIAEEMNQQLDNVTV
jgi:hypothetical protein